ALYETDFNGTDRPYPEQKHSILGLQFRTEAVGDELKVDDLEVFPLQQKNPTVFVDTLVDRLKELRPGILRNWSNQIGDSLDNQLASPFARKVHNHSPRTYRSNHYSYSLHEFLELCKEVSKAAPVEPWYVIPPTFSRFEY